VHAFRAAATILLGTGLVAGLSGCSSAAAADMRAGDCLRVGGPPDRPDVSRVECGSATANFKVVDVVGTTDQCPEDVDSYYSTKSVFGDTGTTICMDIAWVVGNCMSVDPANGRDPYRVDCADTAVPHRQRATQILADVANVDQCASGLGYPYDERQFTVCVEGLS
jgi:hypothetical protein